MEVLAVLITAKSAEGVTVSVAVAETELEPTEVVSDPTGIALMTCGDAIEVTTTDTEQLVLGEITVPEATVNIPALAVADGAGPEQVDTKPVGLEFTKPDGYMSVNTDVNVADTNLWLFVNVMTNNDVPPALIALGANVLDTCGTLNETASESDAVQVPATHEVAVLVLVTLAGVVMEAVLVICVWAMACWGIAIDKKMPNANKAALEILINRATKRFTRSYTPNATNDYTPNLY